MEKEFAALRVLLKKVHLRKKRNLQQIVFVVQYMKPRVAKIAYALQAKGYKVTLFIDKIYIQSLNKEERKYFTKVVSFSNSYDIFRKCLWYQPLVYHIFTESFVPDWAQYLISNKEQLGKIVFDQYDVYRGIVNERFDDYSRREKYCLENADGLCCRMFETQYLKMVYGYQYKGKRILFLDYCWNMRIDGNIQVKDHKNLRFVYGGRLVPASNSDWYKIERNGFEYIAQTLYKRDAFFVVIPTRSLQSGKFSAYKCLKKRYRNFILKDPLSFSKLIRYESHMDYGIDCVELKKDIVNCRKVTVKNKYYATNKYFDYLDAGIMPLYGREQERFGRYLAFYGGALKCTLEELPERLNELNRDKESNKEKARKAREELDIKKQICRLIKFYMEL